MGRHGYMALAGAVYSPLSSAMRGRERKQAPMVIIFTGDPVRIEPSALNKRLSHHRDASSSHTPHQQVYTVPGGIPPPPGSARDPAFGVQEIYPQDRLRIRPECLEWAPARHPTDYLTTFPRRQSSSSCTSSSRTTNSPHTSSLLGPQAHGLSYLPMEIIF